MRGRPAPLRVEPSPGDVGRFALHMDPQLFATRVAQWCGDDVEIRDVATWFAAVSTELIHIRDDL